MDRLANALNHLSASLRRLKELSTWRELKQEEAGGRIGMVTEMYDPTEGDLKVETGFFFSLAASITEYLTGKVGPEAEKARERISRLEREFWKFARV